MFTWNDIAKAYRGHGDETKVKGLEKCPILPNGEDRRSDAQEESQEEQREEGGDKVVAKSHADVFLVVLGLVVQLFIELFHFFFGDFFSFGFQSFDFLLSTFLSFRLFRTFF